MEREREREGSCGAGVRSVGGAVAGSDNSHRAECVYAVKFFN